MNLPKQIRQEINQLAHRLALRYEYEERDSLMEQFKAIAETGASLNEITKTLKSIEAQRNRKQG